MFALLCRIAGLGRPERGLGGEAVMVLKARPDFESREFFAALRMTKGRGCVGAPVALHMGDTNGSTGKSACATCQRSVIRYWRGSQWSDCRLGQGRGRGLGRCRTFLCGRLALADPWATMRPPPSPPSGPRSMIQSACLMTSRWCSMIRTVLPSETKRWRTSRSLRTSSKCRPVVGSSWQYKENV